jgi:hypothetical protein
MPTPSEVEIFHVSNSGSEFSDGQNITENVLFSTAKFEAQSGAGVGTFNLTLKDVNRDLDFAYNEEINTGDLIMLDLDGTRYFGGFIQQVGRTFAFPVVDTTLLSDVKERFFALRGSNYNILFDRLVAHNDADHLHALPAEAGTTQAGTLVTKLWNDYIDKPVGFNVTSKVDPVGRVHPYDANWGFFNGGEQGIPARQEMDWISYYNGAIYYFDANKRLHYHAPEKVFAPWGFSDRPNKRSVLTTHTTFSGATYGFRELDTTQDLTGIVNDVFVWGGSPFVASSEPEESGVVFARRQNTVSQAAYGRWQMAEVAFGTLGTQNSVNARAEKIVPPNNSDFPPGIDNDGVIRNRSKPGWNVRLSWFAHDVPTMENGVKRHLVPGEIVTIILYVHGAGLTNPLILTLPLRRVSISFPTLPSNTGGAAETFVRFEGEFGLALDDPWQIWDAIGDRSTQIRRTVNAAGSPTGSGSPGAIWQGEPDETTNGTRTTFTLSSSGNPIVYAAASSEVYVNGLRLRQGADYSESPSNGKITLFVAPVTGSTFWVTVRLAG